MTTFLQIIALAFIIAASVGWGRWVWDTNRPIHAPERLNQILVYGVPEAEAKALADAVAVGIIGRIAEHTRIVAFINEAAASAESTSDIRALTRVSQPAPSLIEAARAREPLDIAIEFAGSKVETKGLQRFLQFGSPNRGALSISLLLEERNGKLTGLASSNFPGANAYGFAVPIEGDTQEIAERIAMRFVQAHYAAEESFYSALDPADFRTLWKIRRRAAEIALRASGGSATETEDPLKVEAKAAYNEIAYLVNRYTRIPEFQRLGAYLASVSEEFEQARIHLQLVKESSQDTIEQSALDQMIAALMTDAEAQRATASASVATRQAPPSTSDGEERVTGLERNVLDEPDLIAAGITALADRVRETDTAHDVEIALVLGAIDEFEPFGDRITPLADRDRDSEDRLLSHTQNVAALIATLAPKAKIRVIKALSGTGSGTKQDVIAAIDRAAATRAQIIVIPLGPFDTEPERMALKRAGENSLVLVAAGNESQELKADMKLPSVVFVGAVSGGTRASYSNYGESVALLAPGSVLTFDGTGELQRMNGTSFSAAIVAAAAANIAALDSNSLGPGALKNRILANTVTSSSGQVLRIASSP
jgi:hypothetical protein